MKVNISEVSIFTSSCHKTLSKQSNPNILLNEDVAERVGTKSINLRKEVQEMTLMQNMALKFSRTGHNR